ncbi:MAG: class I SAM-dependent methyltransferase, partial [Colwellia sp.]|nr:class I SAM-dependent methyltransferase [Colwellia sp.]
MDFGCGSGRIIDFFNKNFNDKNLIGIEYFTDQYEYCKKAFQNKKNIKIIQADFTKSDFF